MPLGVFGVLARSCHPRIDEGERARSLTLRSRPRGSVPAGRMDPAPTPLAGIVEELAASERFRAFIDAFPADARVSEPVLPLVLATLHATLERSLVCLLA